MIKKNHCMRRRVQMSNWESRLCLHDVCIWMPHGFELFRSSWRCVCVCMCVTHRWLHHWSEAWLPGRGAWGPAAGSASWALFPGTPGPSWSPPPPAEPWPPTRPGWTCRVFSHFACPSKCFLLAPPPSSLPPPAYLVLSLLLPLVELQPEGEFLQGRPVQRVLGALELDDLVEDGPQLVQQRLRCDTEETL